MHFCGPQAAAASVICIVPLLSVFWPCSAAAASGECAVCAVCSHKPLQRCRGCSSGCQWFQTGQQTACTCAFSLSCNCAATQQPLQEGTVHSQHASPRKSLQQPADESGPGAQSRCRPTPTRWSCTERVGCSRQLLLPRLSDEPGNKKLELQWLRAGALRQSPRKRTPSLR